MIAITIGTTQWHPLPPGGQLAANQVAFAGEFLYEANGFTPAMVWDEALQNVRPRNAAEILTATKALRIEQDRQECRRRLVEHYGDALEQTSRRDGDYGATAQANIRAGVPATIDASNVARDAINAAATIEAVEAVIVAWPVLV